MAIPSAAFDLIEKQKAQIQALTEVWEERMAECGRMGDRILELHKYAYSLECRIEVLTKALDEIPLGQLTPEQADKVTAALNPKEDE